MLSPVELENKKMYAKGRKYHKLDVDEYLELVYANYKELFNENEELKKQIKTLTEGIQYYRSIESTMQKALLLAEKTSKETKDAAVLKAESIEKEARNKATKIVTEAEDEYDRIRNKCINLVQQFNQYKQQLQSAASEQLRLVTSSSFEVDTPDIEGHNVDAETAPPLRAEDMPGVDEIKSEPVSDTRPIPDISAAQSAPATPVTPPPSLNLQPATEPEIAKQATPAPVEEAVSEPVVASEIPAPAKQEEPEEDVMASFTHTVPEEEPAAANEPEPEPAIPAPEPQAQVEEQPASAPDQTSAQPAGFNDPAPQAPATPSFTEPSAPSVSDKTMVLPDVKSVDREAMHQKEKYSEEQKMQILNAETINLGEAVDAIKKAEKEALEVPDAPEEFETLDVDDAPQNSKSAQGLDTILKNMNIGKKDSDIDEDPFEFLGSVDDF